MSERNEMDDALEHLAEFGRDLPKLARPDDWADLGAHRFTVASRSMNRLTDRLEQQVQHVETLLEYLPETTRAIQTALQRTSQAQSAALEKGLRDQLAFAAPLLAQIEERIAFFEAKSDEALGLRRAVDRDTLALERQRADLERRKGELAQQREAFAQLSTWQRITAGRRWSWLRFCFVPA